MKKKYALLSLLLACVMLAGALSLSACGNGGETPTTGSPIEAPTVAPTEAPTGSPVEDPTDEPTDELTDEQTEAPADEGLAVTFVPDEHVTVTVYPTQDDLIAGTNGEQTDAAVSRTGDTGAPLSDGNGQVSFKLTFAEGYEFDSIVITPEDGYNNLKGSADTGVENGYRITKISAPLTVTVTAREAGQIEDLTQGYAVSFSLGEHVSLVIYRTQDMTAGGIENATVAYSRESGTGTLTKSGDGQVNFKLVFDEGYTLDTITVAPESGYKNLKGEDDTGVAFGYRITKIKSALTVTVTAKPAE